MSRMRNTRNLLQLPVFGLGNLRWVDVRDSGLQQWHGAPVPVSIRSLRHGCLPQVCSCSVHCEFVLNRSCCTGSHALPVPVTMLHKFGTGTLDSQL